MSTLTSQVGWMLIHSMWEGVVVALMLLMALRMMRRASAQARYVASCGAMMLLLFACVATFITLRPRNVTFVRGTSDSAWIDRIEPSENTAPPLASSRQESNRNTDVLRWVVVVWIAGVAILAIRHAIGWLLLQRLRRGVHCTRFDAVLNTLRNRLRISRSIALIDTARIDVPAVIGVFKPIILVPLAVLNDMSPRQIEAILAHELAHIRRHDYLVNLLQTAVETLMFYHPAVWWMSHRIRVERENCCDDIAAAACGDAHDYATALAELESRRPRGVSLAPAASGSDLLARVRRLLELPPARPEGNRTRSIAVASIVLMCVALPLFVSAQKRDATPASTQPAAAAPVAATDNVSPIQPDDLKVIVDDYKVGAGDLVQISITDLMGPGVETVKSVRVNETGSVSLPLVGSVKITGQTTPEVEKTIQKAYRQANLIPNAQVSALVQQPMQQMFSILGAVDRPGQYQIPRADFRVLHALAVAAGNPQRIARLRIVRGERDAKRIIEIPLEKLIAGDLSVNVVMRGGDMVIATPRERQLRMFGVVVMKDSLLHDGKPIDVAKLRKTLETMPLGERRETVLEVSASSPDITLQRWFSAIGQLSPLVKEFELSHLSQTGIAGATTAPATQAAVWNLGGGPVGNSGIYTLTPKKITIEQAIAEAGSPTTMPAAHPSTRGAGDARLQNTLAARERVKGRLDQMSQRLGSEHPVMIRQTRMLEHMDRKIAEETLGPAPPATAPALSVPEADVVAVAQVDAKMVNYLLMRDAAEFNLAVLKRSMGSGSRTVQDAEMDLELQKQTIRDYAAEYRRQHPRPPGAATQPVPAGTILAAQHDPTLAELLKQRANLREAIVSVGDLGEAHPTRVRLEGRLQEHEQKILERTRAFFAGEWTPQRIGQYDKLMAEYLRTQQNLELSLTRMRQTYGEKSRHVQEAQGYLESQQKRTASYADEWRKQFVPMTQP